MLSFLIKDIQVSGTISFGSYSSNSFPGSRILSPSNEVGLFMLDFTGLKSRVGDVISTRESFCYRVYWNNTKMKHQKATGSGKDNTSNLISLPGC